MPAIALLHDYNGVRTHFKSPALLQENEDAFGYLQFFKNISGFEDDYHFDEVKGIKYMGDEGIYGEILPSSIRRLISEVPHISFGADDVFYDLGAGTGKIVAQFAYETRCKSAFGIEIGEIRHRLSEMVLKQLHDADIPGSAKITFLKGDILSYSWHQDATVIFINGLFFPPSLVEDIFERIKSHCLPTLKYIFLIGERYDVGQLNDPKVNEFHFVEEWYECPASWSAECLCAVYVNKNAFPMKLIEECRKH